MATVYWAVIPAAGGGSRFGSALPKQYVPVAGRPVLSWTLSRFLALDWIEGIVVATAAADPHFASLDEASHPRVYRCDGGATRAASVQAALGFVQRHASAPDSFVLVHDAARPCVSADAVTRLRDQASDEDGGLLALPMADTLKRGEGQRVAQTVPRDGLWRAQTPQMFRCDRLATALAAALSEGVEPTDDSQAMERLGARPRLVRGEETNIKLTWPGEQPLVERTLVGDA